MYTVTWVNVSKSQVRKNIPVPEYSQESLQRYSDRMILYHLFILFFLLERGKSFNFLVSNLVWVGTIDFGAIKPLNVCFSS